MVTKENNPAMSVQLLFPTFVSSFKLGRDLTQPELDFLMNLPARQNIGNLTSLDTDIFSNTVVSDLTKFINSKIEFCFNEIYKPAKNVKLRVTQSWVNYTKKDQYHHRHSHSNSFISGVFYINANKSTDSIHFYKDDYRLIDIPSTEYGVINSKIWVVPVETGDLILFPSDLAHSVETLNTDTVRASLSFNTFPVGYLGNDLSLTGLHLRD